MYGVVIIPDLAPVFDELKVKNPKPYENVKKKIEQIAKVLK